ncbi:stAR-related lipid transfer protein 5 [Cricetulus griseus]|nr:stAR-related lipid transfer protein 5 [Cricetulus griseus]
MDVSWATQESEAVAEKVLRYRRDESGWKKCREGVLCVSRTSTPSAAMKLISPRDFVDLVLVKKYEDGTISSNATHVEHPLCPPKPGFVRGFNHPCGCFCEPLPGEPNKTKLVTFFQTDLSGYLPQSVVDSFFPRSMAEFYPNLQKAVRKFHH